MSHKQDTLLPVVKGKQWIEARLPRGQKDWTIVGAKHPRVQKRQRQAMLRSLQSVSQYGRWQWPKRSVYFVTDPHADADAFIDSLAAGGAVVKTGPGAEDFKLSKAGSQGQFVIGGDCLDKGPDNLRLLRVIKSLMQKTHRVKILAGNHDMRLLMGLRCLQLTPDPRTEHFFIRMSPKVVPLLKQVYDHYLHRRSAMGAMPNEAACSSKIYPSDDWFGQFPRLAGFVMPPEAIAREVSKLQRKRERFATVCARHGLSIAMAYAAARKCRQLFIDSEGEFHWFFASMQLAWQSGSLLFVHAGIDDRVSAMIESKGVKQINRLYRRQARGDLFEFYYGPIANTMRTKYRSIDMPLTKYGVQRLHRSGIKAVIHGHRNHLHGQRMVVRKGLLHFECDTTMDSNSRKRQALHGRGAGITIIRPQGQILAISSDQPRTSVFTPDLVTPNNRKKAG